LTLDERGIYSLIQFGAVIPPFTVWREVSRCLPGWTTTIDLQTLKIETSPQYSSFAADRSQSNRSGVTEQAHALGMELDQILLANRQQRRCAVLFSGGVDSSLLAARAAEVGWTDISLAHYAFRDSEELAPATSVAAALGLPLHVLHQSNAYSWDGIDGLAAEYKLPFCDHSTPGTYELAAGLRDQLRDVEVVFDGTGADGAFGMVQKARKWEQLETYPRFALSAARSLYGVGRCWCSAGAVERWARVLTRASQMPIEAAAIAQNGLLGIAYDAERTVVQEVHGALQQLLEPLVPVGDTARRVMLADLVITCAGIFAQKGKSILESRQI
jgi:asparagine synthetase B (glutamine-hydrolysing)